MRASPKRSLSSSTARTARDCTSPSQAPPTTSSCSAKHDLRRARRREGSVARAGEAPTLLRRRLPSHVQSHLAAHSLVLVDEVLP